MAHRDGEPGEGEQGHRWLAALASLVAGSLASVATIAAGSGGTDFYGHNGSGFVLGVVPATYLAVKLSAAAALDRRSPAVLFLGACVALALFLVSPTLAPFAGPPSAGFNIPVIYVASGAAGFVAGFLGAALLMFPFIGFAVGIASAAYVANLSERMWLGALQLPWLALRYPATLANACTVAPAWLTFLSTAPVLAALAPAVAGLGGAVEAAVASNGARPRLPGWRVSVTSLAPLLALLGLLAMASPGWRDVIVPVPPPSAMRAFPSDTTVGGLRVRIASPDTVMWEGGRWRPDRRQVALQVRLASPAIEAFPARTPLNRPHLAAPGVNLVVRGDHEAKVATAYPSQRCVADATGAMPAIRVTHDVARDAMHGTFGIPCDMAVPRSRAVDGGFLVDFTSYPDPYGTPRVSVEKRVAMGIPMCLVVDASHDLGGVRSYWFVKGTCSEADGVLALALMRRAASDIRVDGPD